MQDKLTVAMFKASEVLGPDLDLTPDDAAMLATAFLHALAADLPDEMVERGFDALMSDDRPVNEAFKDALIATLKGAA